MCFGEKKHFFATSLRNFIIVTRQLGFKLNAGLGDFRIEETVSRANF